MAIGRIAGSTLFADLDRNGVDLKFTTGGSPLLALNFTDFRVGINTAVTTDTLTIDGTLGIGTQGTGIQVGKTVDAVPLITTVTDVPLDTPSLNISPMGDLVLSPVGWTTTNRIAVGQMTLNDRTIGVAVGDLLITADGVINTNGTPLTGLPAPTALTDATTKQYVDGLVGALSASEIHTGLTSVATATNDVTITVAGTQIALYTNTAAQISNLTIAGTTLSSATNLTLSGDILTLASTSAMQVPTGTTIDRPGTPIPGYFRYNSDTAATEYFNGADWVGSATNVASQVITANGADASYPLSFPTTATNIIVSINGTLQRPGDAYTVGGLSNDNIIFTSTPPLDDVIEIRYISLGYTVDFVNPPANELQVTTTPILVGAAPLLIDSFTASVFHAAKYTFTARSSPSQVQLFEISLVHDEVDVTLGQATLISTNGVLPTVVFTSSVSAGQVEVFAESTLAINLIVQKTYFAS